MNDIIFEVIRLLVMALMMVVARYLIPWLKSKIGAENMSQIERWAKYAVLMAEQVYSSESGTCRKSIVTEFLKEMLTAKNISLTDDQLDIIIEAVVGEMNITKKNK